MKRFLIICQKKNLFHYQRLYILKCISKVSLSRKYFQISEGPPYINLTAHYCSAIGSFKFLLVKRHKLLTIYKTCPLTYNSEFKYPKSYTYFKTPTLHTLSQTLSIMWRRLWPLIMITERALAFSIYYIQMWDLIKKKNEYNKSKPKYKWP